MKFRIVTISLLCLAFGMQTLAQTPPPPPVPENLTAQPNPGSPSSARLTWQAPEGNWMYRVYRSVDDTSHFQTIGITPVRSFNNYGLMPGHVYNYYVTSSVFLNGHVIESGRSNPASYTPGPPPAHPKGTIAGNVTDDSTGLPIRHAMIRFFRSPNSWSQYTFTDSLGHYSARLDTGTYILRAEAFSPNPATPGYIPEWYDNVHEPSLATPVAVAESSLSVANFGLSRPAPPTFAFISGTVTDTAGTPLRGASVAIMRPPQVTGNPSDGGGTNGIVWRGRTDSLGNYRARVISGHSYIAMASKHTYLPEFYNNKTSPMDADVIVVNGDVSGIDFSLATNGELQNSISGIVRDSLGTGVPSRIVLFPLHNLPYPHPHHVRFGHTDSLGAYTIEHVPTGRYFVLAVPFHDYSPALYKAGAYGVHRWQDADTVTISGNVTGIDVGVVHLANPGLAGVSGHVLAANGQPLEGVRVYATTQNQVLGYAITDAAGSYTISGLPACTANIIADREDFLSVEASINIPEAIQTVDNVNFVLSSATALAVDTPTGQPSAFSLDQNYPNPFNPSTTISFSLPVASTVTVTVFNLIGQEIAALANGAFAAGQHAMEWNGRDFAGRSVSSGLYFYRLKAIATTSGQIFNEMRKMMLVK